MSQKIETVLRMDKGLRLALDQIDDGVWIRLSNNCASMCCQIDWDEARKMLSNLQVILAAAGESE